MAIWRLIRETKMVRDSKDQGKRKKRQFLRSIGRGLKDEPAFCLLSSVLLGCTFLVIYVFYRTLFFNKDSISHPLNVSCLKTAIFILFFVALLAPIVTMYCRWHCHQAKIKKGESDNSSRWESDIVTYLIHFIPFFILSLALLFQLENVVSGKTSSMAAIAGVMILYMLSSLGAGILQVVNEMKNKASDLQENLGKADSAIQAIPIIKHFSKIIGSGEGPRLAKPIEDLTESWASIADKDRKGIKGVVLRTLLYKYFKEENKDVTGGSDRSRVPKECWPYFDNENTTSHKSEVAFLATNVGFYTNFLAKAIEQIIAQIASDSQKKLVPCIATITNVLPSHFWNWPRSQGDRETRHVYEPILRYRNMLNKMVSHSMAPGRVYRTILVNKRDDEEIGMDPKIPLWTWEHWEWEREWYFNVDEDKVPTGCCFNGCPDIVKKNGNFTKEKLDDLIEDKEFFEYFTSRYTDPQKKEVKVLQDEEKENKKLARYYICRVKQCHLDEIEENNDAISFGSSEENPPKKALKAKHKDGTIKEVQGHFRKVVDYYKQYMHPDKNTGYTQILGCNKKEFLDSQGFCGRPDVLFLGSCPRDDYEDIWNMKMPDDDRDSNNWYLMLIATMSPQSETMFLTVVYDHDLIKKHWEKSRKAVLDLKKRIKDNKEKHFDHYGEMPD